MSATRPPNPAPQGLPEKGTSLTADAWRRLKRNKLAVAGACLLLAVTLLCIVGPLFTGFNPEETDPKNAFLAPSDEHLFGTDSLGRDYFTRVLVGGQTSLAVGFVATLVCLLVGTDRKSTRLNSSHQ